MNSTTKEKIEVLQALAKIRTKVASKKKREIKYARTKEEIECHTKLYALENLYSNQIIILANRLLDRVEKGSDDLSWGGQTEDDYDKTVSDLIAEGTLIINLYIKCTKKYLRNSDKIIDQYSHLDIDISAPRGWERLFRRYPKSWAEIGKSCKLFQKAIDRLCNDFPEVLSDRTFEKLSEEYSEIPYRDY
jgi:hypothetical protein